MKKKRVLNNKGFSLVELIIVIAIMAILTGVLAPQFISYLEKANVASDTQVAVAVKTVVELLIIDQTVLAETASVTMINKFKAASGADLTELAIATPDKFSQGVWDGIGFTSTVDLYKELKSKNLGTPTIKVFIDATGNVEVTLPGTSGGTGTGNIIEIK